MSDTLDTPTTEPAIGVYRNVAEGVERRVERLVKEHRLAVLGTYDWRTALKTAWIRLQDAKHQYGPKKGQRILDTVTETSVAAALLDMVAQALDPVRKQVDFIPYDDVLTCSRSRWGDEALAANLGVASDVRAMVIFEGDSVEIEVEDGRRRVTSHKQSFGNLMTGNILGAYALAIRPDGSWVGDVMTIDDLKASWSQSKQYKYDDAPQKKFPEEFAKRTITRRMLKPMINASAISISPFLAEAIDRSEDEPADSADRAHAETITVEANTGPILTIDDDQDAVVVDFREAAEHDAPMADADGNDWTDVPPPEPVPVPATAPAAQASLEEFPAEPPF